MKCIILSHLNATKINNKQYMLLEDFKFKLNECEITIPKNTKTDFASIPFPINLVFKRDDDSYRVPSLIHDYCYTIPNKLINKHKADLLFREMLIDNNVNVVIAYLFYFAVYLFGKGHWKTNDKP